MLAACRLDTTDKIGCVDSSDCVGTRICLAEECSDEACSNLCSRYCDRAQTCGSPSNDCVDLCPVEPSEEQCKDSFDELAHLACSAIGCLEQCAAVCDAALECALIDDRIRCIDGCWAWGYCPQPSASCSDLPNVSCYKPATPCE